MIVIVITIMMGSAATSGGNPPLLFTLFCFSTSLFFTLFLLQDLHHLARRPVLQQGHTQVAVTNTKEIQIQIQKDIAGQSTNAQGAQQMQGKNARAEPRVYH